MSKTKNLVILTITVGLTFVASTKQKRDVFETMQSAAMLGASEVASKFQEGVGFKDNSDREINFFGAKVGGGHNFKTGFGHAVDENSDESSERRRRSIHDEEEITIQTKQTYGKHGQEEGEIILVEQNGDSIIINDENHFKTHAYNRKPRFEQKEEDIIIVDNNNGNMQKNEDDIIIVEQRKRRSTDDSGNTFHERFERNALRSYSPEISSESTSEEEYDTTDESTEMQRNKRAAKPCSGGRRTQPVGDDNDYAEEFQQLKKSKNKKRGKRQVESLSGVNSFTSPNGSDIPVDDQDERFQQFMEQMMQSVKKVAMIARKVQEAFQQPPTGSLN